MKTTALVAASLASAVLATNPLTPEKVEADIKTNELQNVLWKLGHIAKENGGNRAFGLPGFAASMDYVLERAQKRFGRHMDTWIMPFNHTFEQTRDISVTGPDGEDVFVISLLYNHPTPLPDGITAPLIDTPVDDERGSGCFPDQWEGIDATGKIALVKRGLCAISDKIKNAKAAGALGVIMYHLEPGTIPSATLSAENIGLLIPIGTIPNEVGVAWKERLGAGEELVVNLYVDSVFEERETWNVFSETKEGDPNNVIMLGAHLDSVQAGPGVNDDGSGTAALLELMGSFKKYDSFPNKVRFAWWGAEESGLIGSLKYTESLTEEEADKIRLYFNYDMIGSIEPFFRVYQSSEADRVPANPIRDYLIANGKDATLNAFGTSSDYVGFLNLGIPSSGIFTGAGAPEDPCYHQACDTIDNVNWDAITLNTKAAGVVAAKFALSLEGVPLRTKTSVNPRSREGVRRNLSRWRMMAEEAETGHSCAHKGKMVF